MKLYVVGLGPGELSQATGRALQALEECDVIAGYTVYIDLIKDRFGHKKLLSTPMKKEVERCRLAVEETLKGQKVAIIGGGAVGLDVMEFFTERGAEVTMVEMLPMIGNGLDPVTKCDTNAKMAKYGVKQMTNTALQEVKNDRFIVKNPEGEIEEIPFDHGFICLGMRANTPVISEIEDAFIDTNVEIVNIGDSKRARRIIEGTEEGRNILNVLERHDFL